MQILVIDDDLEFCQFVRRAAQTMGIECQHATDARESLDLIVPDVELIFLDLIMPGMDGIELLRLLGAMGCKADIVLMSGLDKRVLQTAEEWAKVLGLSVAGHLRKPFRLKDFELMIQQHRLGRPVPSAGSPQEVAVHTEELQRAIAENQFLLHFQPQIDIATGKIMGVEALVRWMHPDRGMIFPDHFIDRAEQLGLIDQLSWIVVHRGLTEMRRFQSQTDSAFSLSINIATQSFRDLKFPETLLLHLRDHGVPAESVTLEITESGLIQELSSTLEVLTRLRMQQVHLSVDDFGTGYSMMRQLRRVPATELKIDRSFVQNIFRNDHDRVLVEKTIEIGHELGMKVVAEGVETAEQLDFLRERRCDIAQGYLFSRPLPTQELLHWFSSYTALN